MADPTSSAHSPPASVAEMLRNLDAAQARRLAAARPEHVRAWEAQLGLPPVDGLLVGRPQGWGEYLQSALNAGLSGVGQTAAGLGSYLPGTIGENYEQRRKMYGDRRRIYAAHARRFTEGEAARVPVLGSPADVVETGSQLPLELVNPVSKPGAAARLVNMTWHAARGYAPEKSVTDAALAAGSHLVGEKVESLLPSGNISGNVAGVAFEKVGKETRDALFPPAETPAPAPARPATPLPFAVVPAPAPAPAHATTRRAQVAAAATAPPMLPTRFLKLMEQRRAARASR